MPAPPPPDTTAPAIDVPPSSGRISMLVAGLAGGILVTAVHQEGRLQGPDVELMADVVAASRHPIQASGGIRDLADLRALARAGAALAVVGMAFYTGALDRAAVIREFTA